MPLDLKSHVGPYIESAFAKTWGHNRILTIGASEIGACWRRTWYAKKLGKAGWNPKHRSATGATVRGDLIEDNFSAPLVAAAVAEQMPGAELIWHGQANQQTFVAPEWKLSATPDGLIINAPVDALVAYGVNDIMGDCVLLELKSIDSRTDPNYLPKPQHVVQVNTSMGLIRKDGRYNPAWALIVYIDAGHLDTIHAFPVPFDKVKFEGSIRRALRIMGANDADQLRPEGKIAGEKECNYCPFSQRCLGYAPKVPWKVKDDDELPVGFKVSLMKKVGTIDNSKRQIRALQITVQQTEAAIKELLAKHQTKRASGAMNDGRRYRVSWDQTPKRKVFDAEALEALFVEYDLDPDDFKKDVRESERLIVSMQQRRDFEENLNAKGLAARKTEELAAEALSEQTVNIELKELKP